MAEFGMDFNFDDNLRSSMIKKAFAQYRVVYGTDMDSLSYSPSLSGHICYSKCIRTGKIDGPRSHSKGLDKDSHITQHILPQMPIVFGSDGQNRNSAAAMIQVLG